VTIQINPYLNFRDNAAEAMEFYRSVFGGELSIMKFGDVPTEQYMAEPDKTAHSSLLTDRGQTLMAADTPRDMEYQPGTNVAISLGGEEEEELHGYWDKLADGATIVRPLEKAPWGDTFGQCIDRFGIMWLVNISGGQQS
jgi:PhnB protein